MIKEPRLRFTEEERADPALEKPIRKAEKAAAKVQRGQSGGAVLEGTEVQILADALAQLYACLTEYRFVGPMGLAAYTELSGMMASLMLGEWFD